MKFERIDIQLQNGTGFYAELNRVPTSGEMGTIRIMRKHPTLDWCWESLPNARFLPGAITTADIRRIFKTGKVETAQIELLFKLFNKVEG
jgi:hypothetical protein